MKYILLYLLWRRMLVEWESKVHDSALNQRCARVARLRLRRSWPTSSRVTLHSRFLTEQPLPSLCNDDQMGEHRPSTQCTRTVALCCLCLNETTSEYRSWAGVCQSPSDPECVVLLRHVVPTSTTCTTRLEPQCYNCFKAIAGRPVCSGEDSA